MTTYSTPIDAVSLSPLLGAIDLTEVIELEDPIKHESIKKYIAIRPEIKDHIIDKFEIPEDMIEVIYNPIDSEKFKPKDTKEENFILFVGTIDYLRRETIMDLIEYTRENNNGSNVVSVIKVSLNGVAKSIDRSSMSIAATLVVVDIDASDFA